MKWKGIDSFREKMKKEEEQDDEGLKLTWKKEKKISVALCIEAEAHARSDSGESGVGRLCESARAVSIPPL